MENFTFILDLNDIKLSILWRHMSVTTSIFLSEELIFKYEFL